jgi:hypothetical protein
MYSSPAIQASHIPIFSVLTGWVPQMMYIEPCRPRKEHKLTNQGCLSRRGSNPGIRPPDSMGHDCAVSLLAPRHHPRSLRLPWPYDSEIQANSSDLLEALRLIGLTRATSTSGSGKLSSHRVRRDPSHFFFFFLHGVCRDSLHFSFFMHGVCRDPLPFSFSLLDSSSLMANLTCAVDSDAFRRAKSLCPQSLELACGCAFSQLEESHKHNRCVLCH